MDTLVLPMSTYNLLKRLTGETRPDVALSVALKDLVHLRLDAAQSMIADYEQKYGMTFDKFQEGWQAGKIPDPYSYAVEGDYSAWESALSEVEALQELVESMV